MLRAIVRQFICREKVVISWCPADFSEQVPGICPRRPSDAQKNINIEKKSNRWEIRNQRIFSTLYTRFLNRTNRLNRYILQCFFPSGIGSRDYRMTVLKPPIHIKTQKPIQKQLKQSFFL